MKTAKILIISFSLFIPLILSGCGNNSQSKNNISIDVLGYNLKYEGNELEKINLNNSDASDIIELYQEVGDNTEFKDSLLIAEKYSRGMGVLAFSQDNLQALMDQDLKLENIKKTPVSIEKNKDMLILEYKITEGFIPEVPVLYMSQLFVPYEQNMILISFMSENIKARDSASKMFKNIR